MQIDVQSYMNEAQQAWQAGNLPLVDVLCDSLLRTGHRHPHVLGLQGYVALSVGEHKRAVELLGEAAQLAPADASIRDALNRARKGAREAALIRPDGRKRYLLIKAWGYGFCSDLDHALGGLMLAEMTGRVPVVEWGRGSLFRDDPDEDAWVRFFEPVSAVRPRELLGRKLSCFPPKWNDANLLDAEVNKFEGAWSRMGACLYFNRREDVAVYDFPAPIAQLLSWVRPASPYAGKTIAQAYRMVVAKHLRPRPEVTARVEAFAGEHFTGSPMIAVHARGGDKPIEDHLLGERTRATPALVESMLAQHPAARVFLLTDDENIRREFGARFGEKLVTTECVRTSTAEGLHYLPQASRTRLGIEVLVDMYLAARCDLFVGVGSSNVSAMIEHLKDWPPGACNLQTYSNHETLSPFLYRSALLPEHEAELRKQEDVLRARFEALKARGQGG